MRRIGDSKEPSLKQIHNILSNLRNKYPSQTFQITITIWHFNTETKLDNFQLGTLPGLDGTSCQHFDHYDWPSLLKKYRKIMGGDYA